MAIKISTFYEHIKEAETQEGIGEDSILSRLADAGLQGLEIDGARLEGKGPIANLSLLAMKNRFQKYNLEIATIYRFYDWGYPIFKTEEDLKEDRREAENLVAMARSWGAHAIMAIPGFLKEETIQAGVEAEISCVKENLKEMLAYLVNYTESLKNQGIQTPMVVLEDFDGPGTIYSTMEELESLQREIPGLGIAFDTGNFLYSLQDCGQVYGKMREHGVNITHVHLKDRIWSAEAVTEAIRAESDAKTARDEKLVMYGCPVGEGELPIAEILEDLKDIGFDGYAAAEHFGMRHQLACMEQSVEWIYERLHFD